MPKLLGCIVLLVLLTVMPACKGKNNSISLGEISVNGPGIDGTVPAGSKRLYTLSGITSGSQYTLRTTVTADANLTVDIYSNENEYSVGNAPFANAQRGAVDVVWPAFGNSTITTTYYEASFPVTTADNFVVVIGSPAGPGGKDEFFYDLRLMSPDNLQVFTSPTTTLSIGAGQIHIYSGGTATQAGLHTISLTSTATTTAAYPQLFVYNDATLDLANSLLYSSVTDSMNFWITNFTLASKTTDTCSTCSLGTGVSIPNVLFSSGTSTGPYIVVKGTAAASYSLTINP